MKVKFIGREDSKLKYGTHTVYLYDYDLGKEYPLSKVEKFVNNKIPQIPKYEDRDFQIVLRYENLLDMGEKPWRNSSNGWINGKSFPITLKDYFMYLYDSIGNSATINSRIRFVRLLVKGKSKKIVGSDKHNDCLYNAILQANNYLDELLPKQVRKPHRRAKSI